MKTNLGRDPSMLAVLGLLFFSGCGTNQDPSFVENRRTVKVDLTVNDEDATAVEGNGEGETSSPQQSADHLSSMDDQDVDDVFQSLGTSDETTSDTDSMTSGSDEENASESGEVIAESNSDGTEAAVSSTTKKGGKHSQDGSTSETGGEELLADNSSGSSSSDSSSSGSDNSSTDDSTGGESTSTDAKVIGGEGEGEVGGGGGSDAGDLQKPTRAEIAACAKLNGVGSKAVKVVGNKGSASISSNSVVAIKVAGNQSSLDLSLNGSGSVAAICIFVTGNRGTAAVTLGVGLGNFIYVGRGNSSTGHVNVVEGGSIANIAADLAGNGANLSIQSQGRVTCGAARIHGKGASFTCN